MCKSTVDTGPSCVVRGRWQVRSRLLLRRFELSHNRSLDGVLDQLSNRDMTDAGPLETLDLDDDEDERSADRAALKLPGAQRKGRHQRPCCWAGL